MEGNSRVKCPQAWAVQGWVRQNIVIILPGKRGTGMENFRVKCA